MEREERWVMAIVLELARVVGVDARRRMERSNR